MQGHVRPFVEDIVWATLTLSAVCVARWRMQHVPRVSVIKGFTALAAAFWLYRCAMCLAEGRALPALMYLFSFGLSVEIAYAEWKRQR